MVRGRHAAPDRERLFYNVLKGRITVGVIQFPDGGIPTECTGLILARNTGIGFSAVEAAGTTGSIGNLTAGSPAILV